MNRQRKPNKMKKERKSFNLKKNHTLSQDKDHTRMKIPLKLKRTMLSKDKIKEKNKQSRMKFNTNSLLPKKVQIIHLNQPTKLHNLVNHPKSSN